MQKLEIVLNNAEETEAFAATLAAIVSTPCFIALQGDLGAGKTTFARGFLHALGHQGKVKSPTYTILEPYQIGDVIIHHFDLYRLADPEELELIGAHEMFEGNCINLIEWPEQGEGWLPIMDLWLKIEYQACGRRFSLSASTERGEMFLAKAQATYRKK